MSNFVCSGNYLLRQYLLEFGDELMGKFIENPTLVSCGAKTNCRVYLTNRWLNRAIRPGIWKRFFIVNVSGEDQWAINRCNRLIENCIPEFHKRQVYKTKSKVTLYTNEWIPDNSLISQAEMRIGSQRSQFGGLTIHSPYTNNITRKSGQTPWKITSRERHGHYESGDVYRSIFAQAELGPVDFINPHFPLRVDIAKFNLPNTFDRYTTFKSLDNESLNKKLQQQCCRFIKALKENSDRPSFINLIQDSRQSVEYKFDEGPNKGGSYTKKLKVTDPRNTSLRDLVSEDLRKAKSQKLTNQDLNKPSVAKELKFDIEERSNDINQPNIILDRVTEDDEIYNNSTNEEIADENNDNQNNYRINLIRNQSNLQNIKRVICLLKNSFHNIRETKNLMIRRKIHFYPLNIYTKRYRYHCISRSRRIRYHLLMKRYIRNWNRDKSESRLTYITSPIITETEINSNASKSSNIEDNTLNSLKSF